MDFFVECRDGEFLLGGRSGHHRLGILRFPLQGPAFGHVVEEGEELIELALRNGVVLMIMTAATVEGQAQPSHSRRFHTINDGLDTPFFGDQPPFPIESMITIEAGGHDL